MIYESDTHTHTHRSIMRVCVGAPWHAVINLLATVYSATFQNCFAFQPSSLAIFVALISGFRSWKMNWISLLCLPIDWKLKDTPTTPTSPEFHSLTSNEDSNRLEYSVHRNEWEKLLIGYANSSGRGLRQPVEKGLYLPIQLEDHSGVSSSGK